MYIIYLYIHTHMANNMIYKNTWFGEENMAMCCHNFFPNAFILHLP